MPDNLSPHDVELLQQFDGVFSRYINARAGMREDADDLAAIVSYSLSQNNRWVAFDLAEMLTTEQIKTVLPQVFVFATYFNAYMNTAEDLIFRLPIDWLRDNIATYGEPILQRQSVEAEEFDRIIYMYNRLDRVMTLGIVERALQHADEDIISIGRIWQEKLNVDQ